MGHNRQRSSVKEKVEAPALWDRAHVMGSRLQFLAVVWHSMNGDSHESEDSDITKKAK